MITLAEAVQTIRTAETKWNQIVTDILNNKVLDNNLVRDKEISTKIDFALFQLSETNAINIVCNADKTVLDMLFIN